MKASTLMCIGGPLDGQTVNSTEDEHTSGATTYTRRFLTVADPTEQPHSFQFFAPADEDAPDDVVDRLKGG